MAGTAKGALMSKLGLKSPTQKGQMISRMNTMKSGTFNGIGRISQAKIKYKSGTMCKNCGMNHKTESCMMKTSAMKYKKIKTSGTFHGKSNKLGHGGRAAQLKARGVPGGVIGNLARAAHAAKGQRNYHGK